MAYFPATGRKDSFFAVVHGQRHDGIEFYTEKKVVIERWPKSGRASSNSKLFCWLLPGTLLSGW
jgi:hypothetical protein